MTTQKVQLSKEEINDQKKYAASYMALIQKELSYGDLVDTQKVEKYTKAYKQHLQLAESGVIEMPVI